MEGAANRTDYHLHICILFEINNRRRGIPVNHKYTHIHGERGVTTKVDIKRYTPCKLNITCKRLQSLNVPNLYTANMHYARPHTHNTCDTHHSHTCLQTVYNTTSPDLPGTRAASKRNRTLFLRIIVVDPYRTSAHICGREAAGVGGVGGGGCMCVGGLSG